MSADARERSEMVDPGLDACTRCGFCLQACPTYRVLGMEADSPRGRVFLMKQVAEGEARAGAALAEHLYVCLGCRACETACPSGVPFGRLLEHGRAEVEAAGEIDASRRGWRAFRRIAFEWLLPNRAAFYAVTAPARWLRRWPSLASLLTRLPLPRRMRALLAMLPRSRAQHRRLPQFVPAEGEKRARVGVLVGCVMGAVFSDVQEALIRVLRHNGCEVVVPRAQWCCGALNVHAGERVKAREMARRNIAAFAYAKVDCIVVDSAGCGAVMKTYGHLLRDDATHADRAAAFSEKVKDVSEFLCALGPRKDFGPMARRVTYQDACHLSHGQGIRAQPRALLRMIPGLDFVEMADADRCCGAAGVYSLTRPAMSAQILAQKMDAVFACGAQTVVVTNPGCQMQLLAGAARATRPLEVRHLVEILDEAYAAGRNLPFV